MRKRIWLLCAGMEVVAAGALAERPLGIDVSSYQGGSVNWVSVKSSGVSFAWAKATEGLTVNDADFGINQANAKAAGVLIGAYHYAHPELHLGLAGADQEAAHFWGIAGNYIKGGRAYLMPMLDIEQDLSSANPPYTRTTLSQWVNRWCQDIVGFAAAKGVTVRPVAYTYISYANSWLDNTVTQWPLWMANYNGQNPQTGAPNSTSPWPSWNVWQYSSSGAVPGISGNCDVDVFNGTLPVLTNLLVIGGAGGPTITNPPAPLTVDEGQPATFRVGANGAGTLHYQWRFNQANIAGATASAYTVASAQLADAGGYSVLVTNTGGSVLSPEAFLAVLEPLTNAPGAVVAPSGLTDWWPADGNPNDLVGPYNGVPTNGFSYTAGKQGLAFHFDGATGCLGIGAPSLNPPWTVCVWVNRQNAPGSSAGLLSDGTYSLKLEQYNGTRKVGVTQLGVGDYVFNYTAPAGVWTHLAFVGTGLGTLLYANGVWQGSLTNVVPLPRGYLGATYVASGDRFVDYLLGGVDDVLCFNRALSGAEIGAIYAAGSAGLVRAPEFTGIASLGGAGIQLKVRALTGKNVTFYGSTNWLDWFPLGTSPNPTGTLQYTDAVPRLNQKFYRAAQ